MCIANPRSYFPTMAKPGVMSTEGDKLKQLDKEIRDMVSALTRRLAELQHIHKPAGSSSRHPHHGDDEDHHFGSSIITLAGNNTGATMRSDMDADKSVGNHPHSDELGDDDQPLDALKTYINSNFQAVNNSIMVGGSYSSNDPGVHMDVTDLIEHPHHGGHHPDKHGGKHEEKHEEKHGEKHDEKHGKKGKKDKMTSKIGQQTEDSD